MASEDAGYTKPECGVCHDTGIISYWDGEGKHDTPCPNGCKPPDDSPMYSLTEYGFNWGAMEVTRYFSHRGMAVLRIGSTGSKRYMEIYISPAGRNITAYPDGNSCWLLDGRGGVRLGRK